MNEIPSTEQLKATTRARLSGHYPFLIAVFLLSSLIIFFLSMCIPYITDSMTALDWVIFYLSMFFVYYISEIIRFRICGIYLKVSCNHPVNITDLFFLKTGKNHNLYYLAMFFALFEFVCVLPSQILQIVYLYQPENTAIMLDIVIATISGLLAYGIVYLHLFPAYYLAEDFPNYTAKEILHLSFYLMKKNRFRLFYLIVSFLPILLLGITTCGLGLLWLIPYFDGTLTSFYLDLTSRKSITT